MVVILEASGSTKHFFDNCGIIQISSNIMSEEKALEFSAKTGALDCIKNQNLFEIITKKEDFYKVKSEFEKIIKKLNLFWNRMETKKFS